MTEHRLDLAEITGWIVYRLYDAQDTLLYVGQTTDLTRRLAGHRTASVFWPRVHHIVFEHADTRRTMEDLEHQLIRTHQPPYNTVGLGPYQERQNPPIPPQPPRTPKPKPTKPTELQKIAAASARALQQRRAT